MRKLLSGVLSLLLATLPLSAQGIGGGIFGEPRNPKVLTVCASGCQYTTICGADCTSEATTCAAGSAMAVANASSTLASPYIVEVGPGVYNECVNISGKGITLRGSGMFSSIIRPTVTLVTDVDGGALRIGQEPYSACAETEHITIENITVWNDAASSPESAIQIGKESGGNVTGETAGQSCSPWNDIYIHNVRTIGHHDSIQWFGGSKDTDTNTARLTLLNIYAIGGRDNIVYKGYANTYAKNVRALTMTNYCETSDPNILAVHTGVVAATPDPNAALYDINKFPLAVADVGAFAAGDFSGRQLTLNDTDPNTLCGASDGLDGEIFTVIYFDSANYFEDPNLPYVVVVPDPSEAVDAECTYTLAAIPTNSGLPPCRDIDWSTLWQGQITIDPNLNTMDTSNAIGQWKTTGFHRGVGLGAATHDAPPDEGFFCDDCSFEVIVNDFGGAVNSGCYDTGGQANTACILYYSGPTERGEFNNTVCRIDISHSLSDKGDSCLNPINGIAIQGNATKSSGRVDVEDRLVFDAIVTIMNNAEKVQNINCALMDEGNNGSQIDINDLKCEINDTASTAGSISSVALVAGQINFGQYGGESAFVIQDPNTGTWDILPGGWMTATATIDAAADTDGCADQTTITVPGAATGDVCNISEVTATTDVWWTCRVTAADTVTPRACVHGTLTDPASTALNVVVTGR